MTIAKMEKNIGRLFYGFVYNYWCFKANILLYCNFIKDRTDTHEKHSNEKYNKKRTLRIMWNWW